MRNTSQRELDEQTQVLGVRITFPEVNGLKYVSGRDSVGLSRLQELGDLLHLLKGHLRLWNLPDRLLPSGIEAVDKPAENLGRKIGILDVNLKKKNNNIFLSIKTIKKTFKNKTVRHINNFFHRGLFKCDGSRISRFNN